MKMIPVLLLGIVLAGCAAMSRTPVFYPNAKFKQVGESVAQKDVDECTTLAEKAGAASFSGSAAASSAARTGMQGAAMGAAGAAVASMLSGGSIVGDAARGAAIGGAAGAAGGAVAGGYGDPMFRTFVGRCLGERGYEVIGWK